MQCIRVVFLVLLGGIFSGGGAMQVLAANYCINT